ncbi:MAG TPA: CoA transferase [Trueperaceae bacterium]
MSGPLAGLKVLDLSRVLAGPYATQVLADLGADVWKVESLRGDDTRQWGPPFAQGESAYYLSANRGKQSLAVDLKDPRGAAAVLRLAQQADVLVENFKRGDLARYGLDYAALEPRNSRLVYASVTGFGQHGPRAREPGYDAAIQGLSGVMSITGEPGGPPEKVGVAWVDVLTGLHLAVGVMAALWEREQSGRGQYLDLALFDVALASLVNQAQAYLMTGVPPQRLGSMHPQIVPYGAFEAEDGWFMLAVGNDAQFERACRAIGLPELWQPRFRSNAGRVANRLALLARLQEHFRTGRRDSWLERLTAEGVPATPVNDIGEALADPQVKARNMRWQSTHPLLGRLQTTGSPLQFLSRTPAAPSLPPPLLGQHSADLLRVAGFSDEEIAELERDGVIHAGRTD